MEHHEHSLQRKSKKGQMIQSNGSCRLGDTVGTVWLKDGEGEKKPNKQQGTVEQTETG